MSPAVSIVVLCYRHERFIGDCLASILAQPGDFEVIVVDDASPDGSVAVIERFDDPRLRLIRHDHNQGAHATMTDGLHAARAPIIARLDGDDRYRPGFLAATLPLFEHYPEVGTLFADVALIDEAGRVTQEHAARAWPHPWRGNLLVRLMEENFICAPTLIARRAAWLDCLPIPPDLAFHDWYFTLMMARRWPFAYLDQMLADYRVHSGNMHTHIARDQREERSIFHLLDHLYAGPETDPALEAAKQQARGRIYGRQYLTLANKYFGFHLNREARRCYLQAIRHHPPLLRDAGLLRRLAATLLGRARYEALKGWRRGAA